MAAPKGNKFAAGCENSGRPLKFKSAEELQQKIDNYFKSCYEEVWVEHKNFDDDGKFIDSEWKPVLDRHGEIVVKQIRPFTITGLALALDTTRDVLIDYEDREEFSHTIKNAKMIIHNFIEEQCVTRDKPTGVIFNLKNNFGWKDKSETALTGVDGGAVEINVNIVEED